MRCVNFLQIYHRILSLCSFNLAGILYIHIMIINTDAINRLAKDVFTKGSRNFYTASLFFPRHVGRRVAVLYAFVRTIDDFVDSIPQQIAQLDQFEQQYRDRLAGSNNSAEDSDNALMISAFVALQQECAFDQKWIDAFFNSMRFDTFKTEYNSEEEILEYMYGSAEVVGLCVMRILGVDPVVDSYACLFGRALQYINFIRDLEEDNAFGRRYLPLPKGMTDLKRESAEKNHAQFIIYIRHEIDQFRKWLHEGVDGLGYIPRIRRIPIQTAGNLFASIANKIYRDPFSIYRGKVGLSRTRIVFLVVRNAILIILFGRNRRSRLL